jgi:hypothetical protein
MPWLLFYALLVVTGTSNFAATSLAAPMLLIALGFAAEVWILTHSSLEFSELRPVQLLAHSGWISGLLLLDPRLQNRLKPPEGETDRLWFWFRDRWGAAWALRIIDRFNREAEVTGSSFRLTWRGLLPNETTKADEAEKSRTILSTLLKRFATSARLKSVVDHDPQRGSLPQRSASRAISPNEPGAPEVKSS